MAKQPSLSQILAAINKLSQNQDKSITQVNKRLSNLERDMKKVLKCVATENADFEIKSTISKKGGGGSRNTFPMAAKSQ